MCDVGRPADELEPRRIAAGGRAALYESRSGARGPGTDRGAVGEREAELMNRASGKTTDVSIRNPPRLMSKRVTGTPSVTLWPWNWLRTSILGARRRSRPLERWDAESSWFIVVPVCESI